MATITACPHCGANDFIVQEVYWHAGALNERGVLVYKSDGDGGPERIECANCGRVFGLDDFVAFEYV